MDGDLHCDQPLEAAFLLRTNPARAYFACPPQALVRKSIIPLPARATPTTKSIVTPEKGAEPPLSGRIISGVGDGGTAVAGGEVGFGRDVGDGVGVGDGGGATGVSVGSGCGSGRVDVG